MRKIFLTVLDRKCDFRSGYLIRFVVYVLVNRKERDQYEKNNRNHITILMAASTFTACSQANGVAESSVDGSPETAVSTVDETVESTQKATSASKTVTAETSPVSDKTESSTNN